MDTPVIDVENVCFAYGEQEVLHNVSFVVPACAFVTVVGPNGGSSSPSSSFSSVLLPEPLGPMMPILSPRMIFAVKPSIITCWS